MKKILPLILVFILFYSCAVKQIQSQLSSGDYDDAVSNAIVNLQNNKDKKRKQDYIYLLEEAFAKAKDRDLRNILLMFKDANPNNLEKIYTTYLALNNRQEAIRPLLPLHLMNENRNALFPFDDYSDQIISSKNALSKHLYENSKALIASKDKMSCRRAYDDLNYLETINQDYKETHKLMLEAKLKGTDYVSVFTKNETNIIIPIRLQNDLLDFSTYGLNDKWTIYDSNRQKNINYDYGIIVNFRQITISPEQIKEKEFVNEKQIKDGVKKLLDTKGNVVKDSLGKPIMVDNFKTIKIIINEFSQQKSSQIAAKVDFINFNNNQLIDTFPLTSEFVFSNTYATYKGDRQASDENYYQNFDKKLIPFPSNEQMVYDCGEDLKSKLKTIIINNKIRK